MKSSVLKVLQEYKQEHLLRFYEELNASQQESLLKDIKKIDFKFMNMLYKNSYSDEEIDLSKISSLQCIIHLSEQEKDKCKKLGENLIKNNQYGIVLMAGGSASRLGLGPKGCLKINVNNQKISLFELFLNQLKKIKNMYNIFLNLYIMTSQENFNVINNFFVKNNFFNYPKECIHFFKQDNLPILDIEGNLLLKDKDKVLVGPNGNGNVFESLQKSNLIKDIKSKNIKYLLFSTIDNVLTKLIDLEFIGATIANNYELASKTITKNNQDEKDWVFCKYNNRPFMLSSRYIDESITNTKNEFGEYVYREKNVTHHLIATDLVIKFAIQNLKYHRAYKKNNYININGEKIIAMEPNTFKFEQFIFDAFYYAEDMLLYRITEKEFLPIKTKEDIKKAEKFINSK